MRHQRIKGWLWNALVALFWLEVWQVASQWVGQELLVPAPAVVLRRLGELAVTWTFWQTVLRSCLRIMEGFLLALMLGTLLAVGTSLSKGLRRLLYPLQSIIKATPVASFIILALVWISTRHLSIFISFLMVLPLVWSNLYQGIQKVDPKLLEMAKVFGLSTGKKLRGIYIPSVLPYFLSAATTGLGFAWKAGVAAEVLGKPSGSIGTMLSNAKIYLETPDLFAWTIVVILLSMAIEKGMLFLFGVLQRRWRLEQPQKGGRL